MRELRLSDKLKDQEIQRLTESLREKDELIAQLQAENPGGRSYRSGPDDPLNSTMVSLSLTAFWELLF